MTRGRKYRMRAPQAADKAEAVDAEECAWAFPEWEAALGAAVADGGGVAAEVETRRTASRWRKS